MVVKLVRKCQLFHVGKSCCCCCCIALVVSDSVRPQRRQPTRLPRPWDSPGKNSGVACHFLLQTYSLGDGKGRVYCVKAGEVGHDKNLFSFKQSLLLKGNNSFQELFPFSMFKFNGAQ